MKASAAISDLSSQLKLQFRAPQPEDIEWVKPVLFQTRRMGSECCFGNLFAWQARYHTEIARLGDTFIARFGGEGCKKYFVPQGLEALRERLPLLRKDAKQLGCPMILHGLMKEEVPLYEAAYPGIFRYDTNRENCDYIYRREDLSALAGKKYHQKRNHIARFLRDNSWQLEMITPDMLDECLEMERRWIALNAEKDPEGLQDELRALEQCFTHYETLGLCGAVLRVSGNIIAFTLGEAINETCFCTHFEKAFAENPGAYQMINQGFTNLCLEQFEFINREEDLGDEGLRRAKLSYYPAILLDKYVAVELDYE